MSDQLTIAFTCDRPNDLVNMVDRTREEQIEVENRLAAQGRDLWPSFVDLLGPYVPRWRRRLPVALRTFADSLSKATGKATP